MLRLLTGDCGAHFHTLLSVALDCARALPAERREVSPSAFTLDLKVTKELLEILSQYDFAILKYFHVSSKSVFPLYGFRL